MTKSARTVLSVLDPVRVHQDFAQLDLVSDGRAEIIAGRSAFVEPFDLFGYPTWTGRYRPPLQDAEA